MSKYIYWIAVLIGLFLVLVYYKGFSSDVGATGGAVSKLVLFLQGRSSTGNITQYPN